MAQVDLENEEVQAPDSSFGDGRKVMFYRAKKKRKDRICIFIPPDDDGKQAVTKIVQHWSQATGKYCLCLGKGCPACKAGMKASEKYVVNILIYPTDKDGKIVGKKLTPAVFDDDVANDAIKHSTSMTQVPDMETPGYFFAVWQFGPDKFVSIRENKGMIPERKHKSGNDVRDIRTRDQRIICTDEGFQKLEIKQFADEALWQGLDKAAKKLFVETWKEQKVDLDAYYDKKPTKAEMIKILGLDLDPDDDEDESPGKEKSDDSGDDFNLGDDEDKVTSDDDDAKEVDFDEMLEEEV